MTYSLYIMQQEWDSYSLPFKGAAAHGHFNGESNYSNTPINGFKLK